MDHPVDCSHCHRWSWKHVLITRHQGLQSGDLSTYQKLVKLVIKRQICHNCRGTGLNPIPLSEIL